MTLGQKIAAARKLKGWSQDSLAEQLNVSHQAVAKWESDRSRPSTTNLFELSKILSLSLEELDFNSPIPTSPTSEMSSQDSLPANASTLWKIALFFLYCGLLLVLLFTCGIVAMLIPSVILLICVGVRATVVSVRSRKHNGESAEDSSVLKNCVIFSGILVLGVVLCVCVWCAYFSITAQYRAKAIWNISPQLISQSDALSSWVADCKEMGDGIYVISTSIPSTENTTRFLIFRHNLGGESVGTVKEVPLNYKFVVTYQANTQDAPNLDTFDVLELSGLHLFHLQFNTNGLSDLQAVFCSDVSPYENAIDSLWAELFIKN